MRKMFTCIAIFVVAAISMNLSLPATFPASAALKAGTACTKANATKNVSGYKYTCRKSGKKLVWSKGVKLATPTPTPTPTPIPTPSPMPTVSFYQAADQSSIFGIYDTEGCSPAFDSSGNQITVPVLQAYINGVWLDVKTVEIGWKKTCTDARLPNNPYLAYAKAAIDSGQLLRWKFIGPVNIFGRDEAGNGISQTFNFVAPKKPITPHVVVGGYGINWENIVSRYADISAAAWTDAQATILRNQNAPSAVDHFVSYISPGALIADPQVSEAITYLKRTFQLYARIPAASHVFFIATTAEEREETETKIKSLYPDSKFMISALNGIYGIDTDRPAGSIFGSPVCQGSDGGSNTVTYPDPSGAAAVILSICPDPTGQAHREGMHGMAHEYAHTIQVELLTNRFDAGRYEPCWMTEGETEWTQVAVSDDFKTYLAMQHLKPYYLTQTGTDLKFNTQEVWLQAQVEAYLLSASIPQACTLTNEFALAYSLGAATIESLVSIGGSESFFALEQHLVAGETLSQAFPKVYGLTWEKALPILAEVVAKKITLAFTPQATTYQSLPKV